MGVRSVRFLAPLLLVATPLFAAASLFHNQLTRSAPEKDETLAASPSSVRLWFKEPVNPRLTSITLLGADSARIAIGKVAATDTNVSVASDLSGPLAPGSYAVVWRTASEDGHVIRGRYVFTVRP